VKSNKNFENIYKIVNFDYVSLYPESHLIDERLIVELKRKITNEERRKKLEKINNIE